MVISTIATIALYCPYCGIPHLHDLNRFFLRTCLQQELLCSCGKFRSVVLSNHRRQWIFQIPCIVCGSDHIVCVDRDPLNRGQVVKLYCDKEKLELGLIGENELVKQRIVEQQLAVNRLLREPNFDENAADPQLLFVALNRIHDIAEAGGLFCHCGSTNIQAALLNDCIEVQCMTCGGRKNIAAQSKEDLKRMETLTTIELKDCRKSHHQR
ncbi:MAG: hypothetical protein H6Q66_1655 [Firmicutes bacterium]|nr:hypothetical protein [Bacillota bacterium]